MATDRHIYTYKMNQSSLKLKLINHIQELEKLEKIDPNSEEKNAQRALLKNINLNWKVFLRKKQRELDLLEKSKNADEVSKFLELLDYTLDYYGKSYHFLENIKKITKPETLIEQTATAWDIVQKDLTKHASHFHQSITSVIFEIGSHPLKEVTEQNIADVKLLTNTTEHLNAVTFKMMHVTNFPEEQNQALGQILNDIDLMKQRLDKNTLQGKDLKLSHPLACAIGDSLLIAGLFVGAIGALVTCISAGTLMYVGAGLIFAGAAIAAIGWGLKIYGERKLEKNMNKFFELRRLAQPWEKTQEMEKDLKNIAIFLKG